MGGKEKGSVGMISARKADHVRIALEEDVEAGSTGFDCVRFIHKALPELDRRDVDTSCSILGRRLSLPLMISAMTGGYEGAKEINRSLARVAQKEGIGLGLGSMRAMIEDGRLAETFQVRDLAPDVLLVGNIGLPQLLGLEFGPVFDAMERTEVDAVAIHLNPLHEATQPEGETSFSRGLSAIEEFRSQSRWPIVVKETGAGISREVAISLKEVGVEWVDVGGMGGTSFAAVEAQRAKDQVGKALADSLADWGMPTAASLVEVASLPRMNVIASGGIRSGLDLAKALSLGAKCAGTALPALKALWKGEAELEKCVSLFRAQTKAVMFLTGSRDLDSLRRANVVIVGWLRGWLLDRGINVARFSRRSQARKAHETI